MAKQYILFHLHLNLNEIVYERYNSIEELKKVIIKLT